MGLYSEPGVPHKGWNLVDVIDLRDDEGLEYGDYEDCEFCDQEQIRYVHLLKHPSYPSTVRVGCICSCKLTNDYVGPKEREKKLRNKANRRQRFPKRKWKTTRLGGKTIELDGHRITVGLKNGKYRLWIDGTEGQLYFKQERDAMLRGYDYIQKQKSEGRI